MAKKQLDTVPMQESAPKKKHKYSQMSLQELVHRVIGRHHVKAVVDEEGGRRLYYYDEPIYRFDKNKIKAFLGQEEGLTYYEYLNELQQNVWDIDYYTLKSSIAKVLSNKIDDGEEDATILSKERLKKFYDNPAQRISITPTQLKNMYEFIEQETTTVLWNENTKGKTCLLDCVLSVENGKVERQEHSHTMFFTNYIDVAYKDAVDEIILADCLNRLLEWAAGDRGIARLLAQLMGSCLQHGTSGGKMFFLTGSSDNDGGNGKSTFMAVLRGLLGDKNCAAVPLKSINPDSFVTAALVGKMANLVDDMSSDFVSDTSFIKSITDGGDIQVNPKNQAPYTAKINAKIIINCNDLPKIGDNSQGMWDRIVVIPFNARFRGTSKAFDRDEFIKTLTAPAYRRAWLQIAINGLEDLLAYGFYQPESVIASTENYMHENKRDTDSVVAFVEDQEDESVLGMAIWDGRFVPDVYAEYKNWAFNYGRKQVADTTFSKQFIKERGKYYKIKRGSDKGKEKKQFQAITELPTKMPSNAQDAYFSEINEDLPLPDEFK